ncbi:MAG: hypothetical protein JST86_09275 [Bacteroidetes bacterium]|nr:hypothetical protein [Bacteroidota bacterium]
MENFKSISTKSLRLYYSVLRNKEDRCTAFLSQLTDKDDPAFKDAENQLDQVKQSLHSVSEEIEKRSDKLIYSIEDIYKLVGQSDSYCSIDFFLKSPAYEKYGESVHGLIWYKKKDREVLDAAIAKNDYERTNGIIYLDSGTDDKKLQHDLQHIGFEAIDIKELYRVGPAKSKTYKEGGIKEIPNTIQIKIDSNFDVIAAQQYVLGGYLKMGYSLPTHDLNIYYRNLLLFYPDLLKEEDNDKYLLKPDKSGFTEEIEYLIYDIKVHEKIATADEIKQWSEMLKTRSDKRMNFIKKHLGISERAITDLLLNDKKRYITLMQSTWMFETETLAYLGPKACIYWDFERFIHIFLRHYPDFFVPASTKGQGKHFQYYFQDIQRVAKIILNQLKDKINGKLESGNQFTINGHYYNGNHYQVRIDPDGKLMQFHPLD